MMNAIEIKIQDNFVRNHISEIMKNANSTPESLELLQAYYQSIAKHLMDNGIDLSGLD